MKNQFSSWCGLPLSSAHIISTYVDELHCGVHAGGMHTGGNVGVFPLVRALFLPSHSYQKGELGFFMGSVRILISQNESNTVKLASSCNQHRA